uniref:UDP-glucose:glycoprotein glucosyltransferase thioredoxin-like domain-containing protein n=1 Tax=Ditylenchus dipsaci TaxID=166011 RepID=A0A915CVE4_9BILA
MFEGVGSHRDANILNCQLYGPFDSNETFEVQDFFLLEKIMERKGAKAVAARIDEWKVTKEGGKSSDVVLRSVAVITKYAAKKKRQLVDLAGDSESVVSLVARTTASQFLS